MGNGNSIEEFKDEVFSVAVLNLIANDYFTNSFANETMPQSFDEKIKYYMTKTSAKKSDLFYTDGADNPINRRELIEKYLWANVLDTVEHKEDFLRKLDQSLFLFSGSATPFNSSGPQNF